MHRPTWLLLAAGLAAGPARAAEPLALAPREGGRAFVLEVPLGATVPTTDAFVAAILDCDAYPTDATWMGTEPMAECRTLERRADGQTVIYMRTGPTGLASPRHAVLALRVVEHGPERAQVDWELVAHEGRDGAWMGPWAEVLDAAPGHVRMAVNHGGWTLDRAARRLTYRVWVDLGGVLPEVLLTRGSVMAFPVRMIEAAWGISAEE